MSYQEKQEIAEATESGQYFETTREELEFELDHLQQIVFATEPEKARIITIKAALYDMDKETDDLHKTLERIEGELQISDIPY